MVNLINKKIINIYDVYNALEDRFKNQINEKIYLIGLSDNVVRTFKNVSYNNTPESAYLNKNKLFDSLKSKKCNCFIISHNHPKYLSLPSKDDINLTKSLMKESRRYNYKLIEHLIYSDALIWPIIKNNLHKEILWKN